MPEDIINFQHDPLACAIALGWSDGVEISELPLKLNLIDGWLHEEIDNAGKLTKAVTKINGNKFNEFWAEKISNRYTISKSA